MNIMKDITNPTTYKTGDVVPYNCNCPDCKVNTKLKVLNKTECLITNTVKVHFYDISNAIVKNVTMLSSTSGEYLPIEISTLYHLN
jgi:hypothetical protein